MLRERAKLIDYIYILWPREFLVLGQMPGEKRRTTGQNGEKIKHQLLWNVLQKRRKNKGEEKSGVGLFDSWGVVV